MSARLTLILTLIAVFACGAVHANAADSHIVTSHVVTSHVVPTSELQAKIDQSLDQDASDHAAIDRLLERPAVQKIAGNAGIQLDRVKGAAALLSGAELRDLAGEASRIDAALSGGDSTIVISTTAIIIALLIIILLTQ